MADRLGRIAARLRPIGVGGGGRQRSPARRRSVGSASTSASVPSTGMRSPTVGVLAVAAAEDAAAASSERGISETKRFGLVGIMSADMSGSAARGRARRLVDGVDTERARHLNGSCTDRIAARSRSRADRGEDRPARSGFVAMLQIGACRPSRRRCRTRGCPAGPAAAAAAPPAAAAACRTRARSGGSARPRGRLVEVLVGGDRAQSRRSRPARSAASRAVGAGEQGGGAVAAALSLSASSSSALAAWRLPASRLSRRRGRALALRSAAAACWCPATRCQPPIAASNRTHRGDQHRP